MAKTSLTHSPPTTPEPTATREGSVARTRSLPPATDLTDGNEAGPAIEPAAIGGLEELWALTLGDPSVCIAVLDGPVDLSHPCFAGAELTQLPSFVPSTSDGGPASQHGTHVASVIFGQHHWAIKGIAPRCRGLLIPIFRDSDEHSFAPCSQVDLARAISQAVEAGANIINISGGQFAPSGAAHPILADVVRSCVERGVLVVAAAGNQGCQCLHIPGAIPFALPVGAMNDAGEPLEFSNWGYRSQGILAPGQGIRGASTNGDVAIRTGTSFATAIVSGVAGLLMSLLRQQGADASGHVVRSAILATALDCEHQAVDDCDRLLAGRINLSAAVEYLTKGERNMTQLDLVQPSTAHSRAPDRVGNGAGVAESGVLPAECETRLPPPPAPPGAQNAAAPINSTPSTDEPASRLGGAQPAEARGVLASSAPANPRDDSVAASSQEPCRQEPWAGVAPSACGCGGSRTPPQKAYALGRLSFDYGSLARRAFFLKEFQDSHLNNIDDPEQLTQYLIRRNIDEQGHPLKIDPYTILNGNKFVNRAKVTSLIWTLTIDETPVYAIEPSGAFAFEIHDLLVEFLRDQTNVEAGFRALVEKGALNTSAPDLRVSIPGVLNGRVRLFTGEVVPIVTPEIRGMYSWTTLALTDATGAAAKASPEAQKDLAEFLHGVYDDTRNLGLTSQERALNFAATNALTLQMIFRDIRKEFKGYEFDTFEVERSPVCRPESDCWDVLLIFYDPSELRRARRAVRFTVDVSDVVPNVVGRRRDFSMR